MQQPNMQQPFEQCQKTYHSAREAERGHVQMARDGWQIVNVATSQPNVGLGRIALIGFWSLIVKPNREIMVIYQRVARPLESPKPQKTIKEAWSKEGWAQAWQEAKDKRGLK